MGQNPGKQLFVFRFTSASASISLDGSRFTISHESSSGFGVHSSGILSMLMLRPTKVINMLKYILVSIYSEKEGEEEEEEEEENEGHHS